MKGILAEFAALTPSWEQLAWAWAAHVRERTARHEAHRIAVRAPRPYVVGSQAVGPSELTPAQKRDIVRRSKRRASSLEIARALGVRQGLVLAYLRARSS